MFSELRLNCQGTPTPTALGFPGDLSQRACRDMEGTDLVVKLLSTWLTLVGSLILLPSAFGLSLGISEIYMKILVKTLEVSAGKEVEPCSDDLGSLECQGLNSNLGKGSVVGKSRSLSWTRHLGINGGMRRQTLRAQVRGTDWDQIWEVL